MLLPVPQLSDSERILQWYALLEHVYRVVDATMTVALPTVSDVEVWREPLHAARDYLGLQTLSYCQGQPAPAVDELDLSIALAPLRALSPDLLRRPVGGLDEIPLYCTTEHYLYGRMASADSAAVVVGLLEQLGRHIVRCIQMRRAVLAERKAVDALYRMLDCQDLAVVLCDGAYRPRFVNEAARRLSATHPQLRLDCEQANASAFPDAFRGLFDRYHQKMLNGRLETAFRLAADGLLLTLIPLLGDSATMAFDAGGPSFGLVIQQSAHWEACQQVEVDQVAEPPPALRERLRRTYKLTDAEIRLAYGIYLGIAPSVYAELANRSHHTIRKQLKSSFGKLGIHDQKSLVLRLWQEQQAGWNLCVAMMEAGNGAEALGSVLLYPEPSQCGTGDRGPALLSLDGGLNVVAGG